jgi:uncharacterized protein YeaO (DUF488 family)
MIRLKRVYDKPAPDDGVRFLVERLWPRGIRKEDLPMDAWAKEAGPSTELRKWFAHDPAKWDEFQRRYFAELDTRPEAWEAVQRAAAHGTVTLLYSSHDAEHNNAVALGRYLEAKIAKDAGGAAAKNTTTGGEKAGAREMRTHRRNEEESEFCTLKREL